MKLEIVNPVDYPQWDDHVLATNDYSFFHSSNWAKVVCTSYNYTPLYFTLSDGGKLLAQLPVMEVRSFLTGRRGVSLAFTDYCEPLIDDRAVFPVLFDHVIAYGRKAAWKHIEFRGGEKFFSDQPTTARYLGHTLVLGGDDQELLSNFRDSTRRNIRKAIQEGVETKICSTMQSVREFYRLHCKTRKRHGMPPQPFRLFRNIYDFILAKNLGFIILASYKGVTIAGAVYFHFGDRALYKYGASDESYQHLRANNLIMWEALKWYTYRGYATFCFGRSELRNEGLRQFKSGWGTTEKQIHYYRYSFKDGKFVGNDARDDIGYARLFRKIPGPLLKMIGQILYRHMG